MKLPVELFLALRYMRPRRTFVSAITILSVLGVTLAVMVLIVVLSVMEGFEQELRDKVIGFNAHLTVTNGGILEEEDVNKVMARVEIDTEILAATPFAFGPVLAQYGGRISTPVVRGIPAQGVDAVLPLRNYVVFGEYNLEGNTILVGEEWARRNGALVGDEVLIYAPHHLEAMRRNYDALASADPNAEQEALLPNNYVIIGIYSTGMYDYDLNIFLTSLLNMQRLYRLGDGAHGVQVRLRDGDPNAVFPVARRLNEDFRRPLVARTWMDQNRPLFNAIATERVVMSIILFFIMIVAGFGLCSTLITITVQKSREIAVLKAMGARDGQVMWVFALHGLVVGIIGSVVGVVAALLLLQYRNPLRELLYDNFDVDVFSKEVYPLPEIPMVLEVTTIVWVALAALAICVMAALIPARAAARVDPARNLHYE